MTARTPGGGRNDPATMTTAATTIGRLILTRTGLDLSGEPSGTLARRMRHRMEALGLESISEYEQKLHASDFELGRLIDSSTTNETRFFREAYHFKYLTSLIYPEWDREPLISRRVWSAGCATGEEAYSLSIHRLGHSRDFTILGTDLSSTAIDWARSGRLTDRRAREAMEMFPEHVRASQGGPVLSPVITAGVSFSVDNLFSTGIEGPFDLIMCRNVMMFMTPLARFRVQGHLSDRLVKGGYLFVGHTEWVHRSEFKLVATGAYRKS